MSKKPFSNIESWSTEEIEWGIQGCGHDQDHVLEKMLKAKSTGELIELIKEYNETEDLYKRYEKILEDRGVK